MKNKKTDAMPTKEELRKKYAKFNDNAGLIKVRNWTMPNDSPKTDEASVNHFMANDDEGKYLDQCVRILGNIKE